MLSKNMKEPVQSAIIKVTEIKGAPWFLLYGGTSEDGRGTPQYMGRTKHPSHALTFYRANIKPAGPYSCGKITAVFDDRMEDVTERWLRQEENKQAKIFHHDPNKPKKPKASQMAVMLEEDKPKGFGDFA